MEKRNIEVAIISDLHLGTKSSRAEDVLLYLKSINPKTLVLNGDIIDGWELKRSSYFPQSHLKVIQRIVKMMANGTKVVYITGNHDEFLRKFSGLSFVNFQLVDKLVLNLDGKKTWIFHGDVFDNTVKGYAKALAKLGSLGYRLLNRFNRFINATLRAFRREPVSFAKNIARYTNKAILKSSNFLVTVSDIAIENNYHYVICGHIHIPEIRNIETKNGSTIYLNSGDWVEHSTALEYGNGCWTLHTHKSMI